jgi:asparagine synthase (glutamine-hydrolysing)
MCGVAGTVELRGNVGPVREVLERAIATLHHRGPDGSGVHIDGPCGLAHARLSILDLAGGAQPMLVDDGALAITFNGEIFNYIELRRELEALGRAFTTRSDTEVILHAYAQWGDACVERMNGQWSFAIWDRRRRRLFCARDRIGVRPFFYASHDGRFVFASEVKALFAAGVPRALDPFGLHEVITFWSALAPRTVWQGISELPPGHTLIVEDGRVDVRRFWRLDYSEHETGESEGERADALFALLLDAARIRLRADVPVGAYLSGGLDSAVIAGLVAKHTDVPLETFSVTFDEADYDESAYQRDVVAALGTRHRSVRLLNQEIGALFPDVIWHTETPILRTAPAPLFKLAGLVRESGYKVVLTGEGADEMLGGYDIFKEAKIRRFWARAPSSTLRPALLRRLYPYMRNIQAQPEAYRRAFFHVALSDVESPFFSHLPRWRLTQQLGALFSADVAAAIATHDPIRELEGRLPPQLDEWDPFAQAQWIESTTLLPGYILASQGDRMAMGKSIEGRFPFLDHRVIEHAAHLPARLKMKVLDEKHLLKVAARGLVPPRILERPKQPYRAPESQSFFDPNGRGLPFVEECLSPAHLKRSGLFDAESVSRLVEKARRAAAGRGPALGARDNMAFVFVLSTSLLLDRFIDGFTRELPGMPPARVRKDT